MPLDSPVLLLRTPVRDISSREAYGECSACAWRNGDSLETSEDLWCVVGSAETDVELGNLVTGYIAGVGDARSNSE
jgi:hypothetical protein